MLAPVAGACQPVVSPVSQPAPRVVTTSNILGEWARQVGGDRVTVLSLIRVGSDAHTFQPGAEEVTRVAAADLVFTVGLGLEAGWLDKLLVNASADPARVVALGELVDPLVLALPGDKLAPWDPHFWFDPLRVKTAIGAIASQLSRLDPAGAAQYAANAQAYREKLDQLDTWIEGTVAQVPQEQRLLVTTHEGLGYFARRYGFAVVGTVIPGLSTEREPSAQELAQLVGSIQRQRAPAIFIEQGVSDRLALSIAQETGVQVVRSLYVESLGDPGSGADSYLGLMRTDVNLIVEALR